MLEDKIIRKSPEDTLVEISREEPLECLFYDVGRMRYSDAFDLQLKLHSACRNGEISGAIIAVEHEPVITLGAKTDPENLLVRRDVLEGQGIEVFQTDRGGDITYHGHGQLVVYPILNLRKVGCDVHQYLRIVEESVMRTLAYYGFESHIRHPAAVWVEERKICSFGIAVRGMVTYHGLALNVAPNMKHFSFINPCGLSSFQMTCLKNLLGEEPSFEQVKQMVLDNLVQLLRLNLNNSGGVDLP